MIEMKKYKISLIIPAHNAEHVIVRCIEGIDTQTYKNIECIIIENGSTDNTLKVCNELATKYDYIEVISSDVAGVSAARNLGLDKASGDIIGFCDADDFLEPKAIEVVVDEFKKDSNIVAVIGAFYTGNFVNNRLNKTYFGLSSRLVSATEAIHLTIGNDSVMGSVWNKYYRADVAKKCSFDTELSFCEDMHFNVRAFSSVSKEMNVKILEKPVYCYIKNSESVTHDVNRLFDEGDNLKYIIAMKAIVRDCVLDKKAESIVKMKIACFCIDILSSMDLDEPKRKKLVSDLKSNYSFLIKNIFYNNWKWNIKRAIFGMRIALRSK